MTSYRTKLALTGLLLAAGVLCQPSWGENAPSNAITALKQQITEFGTSVQQLKQEYDFTLYKRKSTEEKLQQSQNELIEKQNQITSMQQNLGPTPEQAALDAIDNEQRRIALAEINIQSTRSATERLARKEQELQSQILATEAKMSTAQNQIAQIEKKARDKIQAETLKMQRELAKLKSENEKLRLAMEEEARRAQAAKIESDRLAKEAAEADERAKALAADIAQGNRMQANTVKQLWEETNRKGGRSDVAEDLSQTVLPGELPIYKEKDERIVTLRSRTQSKDFPMRETAEYIYEAEITIQPGETRAYFDVKNRRYRGRFPESELPVTYIFTYDINQSSHPKMDVRIKDPEQVVSNGEAPL